MSNLKYVNDDEEFNALMKTAGNDLVVLDFYTTWCGPCRQMEPVIESMVMKHPRVWFLKVDADKCFETAMSHNVKGVPLFVIYMNRLIMDQIQGAHPQLLDQKVAFYEQELRKAFPSVPHLPEDRLSQLSQVISSIGKIREVTQFLDEKGCRCINDLSPTVFDGFLNGKKLISGKGTGKFVMVYSFTQRLMLHSFKIRANAESGPKVLRFFVNHPKVLDFSAGSQLAPAQEVILSAEDLKGDRAIELRSGSFSLVSNLQIFVTEAMSKNHHRVDIDNVSLFGAPVEMTKKLSPDASVGFTVGGTGQSNTNSQVKKVAQVHVKTDAYDVPGSKIDPAENSPTISSYHPKQSHPHGNNRPAAATTIEYLNSNGVDVNGINDLVEKLTQEDSTEPLKAKKSDKLKQRKLGAKRSSNKPGGSGLGQSKKKNKKTK